MPALFAPNEPAAKRFLEFFAANIRNKNTRRAYAQATWEFLAWCESAGVASIADVRQLHVAAYIEQLGRKRSAPSFRKTAPNDPMTEAETTRSIELTGVEPTAAVKLWNSPSREAQRHT